MDKGGKEGRTERVIRVSRKGGGKDGGEVMAWWGGGEFDMLLIFIFVI